uniref:Uncharacterized protein n=1 Tax=Solanum tuberosum TaxID=4113 RepID=M1BIK9_SOLTU
MCLWLMRIYPQFRDLVLGRVSPSRFKVVHSCKAIFTAVLSGWLVRCAAYFTNRKGRRSCLFKWSKPVLVTDIHNNKQTTLVIQEERKLASLFQELKEQRTQQRTWSRKVCIREKDEKTVVNSDVVGAQLFMTAGSQPIASSQGFVSTLI